MMMKADTKVTSSQHWTRNAAQVSVIAMVLAWPGLAYAQQNNYEDSEIVVTAQKRDESVRDVPQSITALTGEALARSGVQSLEDLAAQTPGVSTFSLGGAGQNQITIRGVTTGVDVSPTVATYIDDVPFGSGTPYGGAAQLGIELGSFDVQRVEVLRGPQGTLYGASAFGGLLKYVLQPVDLSGSSVKLQTEGSVTEKGGFNSGFRGAVNLASTAGDYGVRVTLLRNHDAGYVDNAATGRERVNRNTSTVVRVSGLAELTERLRVRGTFLLQNLDRDGTGEVYYDRQTREPLYGDLTTFQPNESPLRQNYKLYAVGADYDADFAQISATYSHQDISNVYYYDSSELYPLLFSGLVDTTTVKTDQSVARDTGELRFTSPAGKPFEWVAGLYYTKERSRRVQSLIGFSDGVAEPVNLGTFDINNDYEEVAAYLNGTYHVSSQFDVTLGARYSHTSQDFFQVGSGLIGQSNPGASMKGDVVTYLATMRYHLDDKTMFYARAASGYRPGGPNLVALDENGDPIGDPTFRPDKLWNYEIGVRSRPLDGVTFDLSGFYIDWSDIQLIGVRNGLGVAVNAGSAVSKGVEASLVVTPLPKWTVSGQVTYTDAHLTDAAPDLGARDGERLTSVPDWSFSVATDYNFDLGSAWARLGATWRYAGPRTSSFDGNAQYPQYNLPAYHVVDLRAGVALGEWDLSLYVRNLFDKRAQLSANTIFASAGGPARLAIMRPRTVGLVATTTF